MSTAIQAEKAPFAMDTPASESEAAAAVEQIRSDRTPPTPLTKVDGVELFVADDRRSLGSSDQHVLLLGGKDHGHPRSFIAIHEGGTDGKQVARYELKPEAARSEFHHAYAHTGEVGKMAKK